MIGMKPALVVPVLAFLFLTSCTTIQNRRDLYFPQPVDGPYTRMLKDGSWRKKMVNDATLPAEVSPEGSDHSDSKIVKPPAAE